MSRILLTATNAMVCQFLVPHIKELINQGHTVDLACTKLDKFVDLLKNKINGLDVKLEYVRLERSPFKLSNHKGVKDLKRIIDKGNYDLIWTNEPVMGIATRIAAIKARKKGTKVIYMAHGFHFFKGAPLQNWLVYYPIEKIFAHFTDVLITINKEDYRFAQKKISAKKIYHIPGIGVDLAKIQSVQATRRDIRKSIGVPEDCVLLLSVGELNANKNHEIVIKALAKLNNLNVHYAIAGRGEKKDYLENLSKKLGVNSQVHLLGYRTDVSAIDKVSDIFCFMSRREGLGLAAIEAMACGLPLITSNVHGINDYSQNGISGYNSAPDDVNCLTHNLIKLVNDEKLRKKMGQSNIIRAKEFSIENVLDKMHKILKDCR